MQYALHSGQVRATPCTVKSGGPYRLTHSMCNVQATSGTGLPA